MQTIRMSMLCVAVAACSSGGSKSGDTDVVDTDVALADTDAVDTDPLALDTDVEDTDAAAACRLSPFRNPANGLDPSELCPGELVITELHVEPQDCGGSLTQGQYLEVFNASGTTVHLGSGLLIDVGAHLAMDVSALGDADVEDGEHFILRPLQFQAYCHEPSANFRLSAIATPLAKSLIRLHNAVDTIDSVDFSGWTTTPGTAIEVRIGALPPTAETNDLRDQWCDAGATMLPAGSTDHGSPGAPNACAP